MIMMTMINDHAHDDRDDDPGQPVQWVGTRWEAHRSDEPSSEVMPCPCALCTSVPSQQMGMPHSTRNNLYLYHGSKLAKGVDRSPCNYLYLLYAQMCPIQRAPVNDFISSLLNPEMIHQCV